MQWGLDEVFRALYNPHEREIDRASKYLGTDYGYLPMKNINIFFSFVEYLHENSG